jgi:hypothetical protein
MVRLVRPPGSSGRRRSPVETDSPLASTSTAKGREHAPNGDWSWRKGRKTTNVRIKTPELAPEYWYPIELYAERDRARKEQAYAYADAASHMLNVAGLKRRATLAKRGTLKPWNKREVA